MIYLRDRAIIEITGTDVKGFLQGLITNNILNLCEGSLLYALMLTAQGKFLYDFFIWQQTDTIYLDCFAREREEIITKLNSYKLARKISITSNDTYKVNCIVGEVQSRDHSFDDPRFPELMKRVYSLRQGDQGIDEYCFLMNEGTLPEASVDLVKGRSFPLEYGLDKFNAIDYQKGCYIGQELIARTKYRGTIRKKLYKIIADAEIRAVKGDVIEASGKEIGVFCSSFGSVGKALLRIDYFQEHAREEQDLLACIAKSNQKITIQNSVVD